MNDTMANRFPNHCPNDYEMTLFYGGFSIIYLVKYTTFSIIGNEKVAWIGYQYSFISLRVSLTFDDDVEQVNAKVEWE